MKEDTSNQPEVVRIRVMNKNKEGNYLTLGVTEQLNKRLGLVPFQNSSLIISALIDQVWYLVPNPNTDTFSLYTPVYENYKKMDRQVHYDKQLKILIASVTPSSVPAEITLRQEPAVEGEPRGYRLLINGQGFLSLWEDGFMGSSLSVNTEEEGLTFYIEPPRKHVELPAPSKDFDALTTYSATITWDKSLPGAFRDSIMIFKEIIGEDALGGSNDMITDGDDIMHVNEPVFYIDVHHNFGRADETSESPGNPGVLKLSAEEKKDLWFYYGDPIKDAKIRISCDEPTIQTNSPASNSF